MIVPESRHVAVNGGGWRARSLPIVIASVATCPPKLQRRRKQSRIPPRKGSGLLRCARNDGARGIGVVLQIPLSFPATRLRQGFAGAEVQGRRSFSVGGKRGIQYAAASRLNHSRLWNAGSPGQAGRRQRVLQTRHRLLAAHLARALLRRSTLEAKRAQGRPGADLAPAVRCAKGSARKPHSSIQVVPITRPSLRDGRTAYAVLSREPSSFWPPSRLRKSPTPRRLTRLPHSQST
ncbi:hypothetical protein ABID60_001040 [Bradyrhizobium sp. S3.5.5]